MKIYYNVLLQFIPLVLALWLNHLAFVQLSVTSFPIYTIKVTPPAVSCCTTTSNTNTKLTTIAFAARRIYPFRCIHQPVLVGVAVAAVEDRSRYLPTLYQQHPSRTDTDADNNNNNSNNEIDVDVTTTTTITNTTTITTMLANVFMSQQRVIQLYRWGQILWSLAAILVWFLPDRTMTTLLATKWGSGAGYACAAGLCSILGTATKEQRLHSNTYKRLNVGLGLFAILGLLAVPGEAGYCTIAWHVATVTVVFTVIKLYSAAVAWWGWTYGCAIDWKLTSIPPLSRLVKELLSGIRETAMGVYRVSYPRKSLTYRNCFLLILLGVLSSFMEGLFEVRYQKEFTRTIFEISLQWSAVSRLILIATIIYSLKDAAERDRLSGTTFIQLNLMVAFWAICVGMGQAVYPLGFAANRGVQLYAFAIPFVIKAYKGYRAKSVKIET